MFVGGRAARKYNDLEQPGGSPSLSAILSKP